MQKVRIFYFLRYTLLKLLTPRIKNESFWICQEIRTSQIPAGKKIKLNLDIPEAPFNSRRQWNNAHKIFMGRKE